VSYRKRIDEKILRREKLYETQRLMREKRSEDREVLEEVLDRSTLINLYHLQTVGIINEIHGTVGSGKEAKIYWGNDKNGNEIAIKIFLTFSGEFKRGMIPYIEGDLRFANVKKDTRSLIFAWTQKEFTNLKRAHKARVNVPKPIAMRKNVLIMEFIGKNGVSAPLLRETKLRNPERIYQQILNSVKKMYRNAKLIHGDLSEYNVMIWKQNPIMFDLSQSINLDHPIGDQFLRRDINNINYYFKRLGVEVCDVEEIMRRIRVAKTNHVCKDP
jgi:RIO kinase 1